MDRHQQRVQHLLVPIHIADSRAMVSVNSIFAGFSGGLLVAIYRQSDTASRLTHVGAVLAMLALLAFAIAAERVTDALDENKPSIYVWSMQFHNLGVVAVLGSLSAFLYLNHWGCPYFFLPAVFAV